MTGNEDETDKQAEFDAQDGIVPSAEPVATLAMPPKPRGIVDRVMRPARKRDLIEGRWRGIPQWACPRCKFETLDAAKAKSHRCA